MTSKEVTACDECRYGKGVNEYCDKCNNNELFTPEIEKNKEIKKIDITNADYSHIAIMEKINEIIEKIEYLASLYKSGVRDDK